MGREEENRRPGAGGPPSAADTPKGVGCRAWRTTRGCLFSFGNERAAALGVPRGGWPPGEGIDADRAVLVLCAFSGVPRGTPHARIVTRQGRDAGTVARSARVSVPIEPCPAGSRALLSAGLFGLHMVNSGEPEITCLSS